MTKYEYRSFDVRAAADDERLIRGLAVPYDQDATVGNYSERFERGAFGEVGEVPLFANHDHMNGGLPIGLVTKATDTDAGLEVEARLSDTTKGNEVYQLLKDGVIKKFSVGFEPVEARMDGETVVRTSAVLRELSVVSFPAFNGADISEVRSEQINEMGSEVNMSNTDNTALDVAELRSAVDELDRKVAVLSVNEPAPAGNEFRSFGEFVKGMATGDARAEALYRDYSGANTGDAIVRNGWVGDLSRLVDSGRPTVNAFTLAALPAEGNSIEYGVLTSNSVASADQGGEGTALGYGAVVVDVATAAVKTFGGYTSMTRQAIERSSVPYLDTVFKAMALGYGAGTNGYAVDVLEAASTGLNTGSIATFNMASILAAIAQGVADIKADTGGTPDFILADTSTWVKLAGLTDSAGRPLVSVSGPGFNNGGNVNVGGLTADIAGIPVVVDPELTGGYIYLASKDSLVTWESAGAPLSLSDDDVTALTRDFSVYGYIAAAVTVPGGIAKISVPAGY